jgi:hypothetical protein
MVGVVTVPGILFIPDRFSDYRMWSDIPDRLGGRVEAIHFEQHRQIPWPVGPTKKFADTARVLAAEGGFDIVVGAGQAARFAFALAEDGLAKGLVLFNPSLDCVPDDIHVDFSGPGDLDHVLDPYMPVAEALDDPDPARRRDIFLQAMRDTAGPDAEPAELELANAMFSDHADEFFADLRDTSTAAADGSVQPDPPWLLRPWLDRLAELLAPVTAVGAGPYGEAIARRARDAEIVEVSGGGALLAPAESRARAAEALLHMLDRIS